MERLTVGAKTTAVAELGEFSALAATWSVDRQGERIALGAFSDTIPRSRESGKDVPVHGDHDRGASAVIGSVDPAMMHERPDGLYVEGKLDIEDSEMAREAWRSVKRNRIGLSFGFLVVDEHDDNGVKVLTPSMFSRSR
jgi:uncharacterized protein